MIGPNYYAPLNFFEIGGIKTGLAYVVQTKDCNRGNALEFTEKQCGGGSFKYKYAFGFKWGHLLQCNITVKYTKFYDDADLVFYFPSTLFQPYRDDRKMTMKGSVQ